MAELSPRRDADAELLAAVAAIRRHWRLRRIIEGVPVVLAAAFAGLLIGLAFRAAFTDAGAIIAATRAAGYLLLAAALIRFMVVPALRRVSDEQVALYLEEQAPELRQVMVSAVGQLRDDVARGASPALYRRVVQQAVAEIDRLQGGAVVERPRTRRALLRAATLAVAGALLVGFGPAAVRDIARVLFVPWSRAAAATIPMLSVAPGDISVPRGASLDVRAELRALADHGAVIVVEPDSADQATTLPMVHDSTGVAYVVRLFDINRNTRYHVEAGGLHSPVYRITVTDLPTVRQLSLELHYPAYTHLAPQRIENGGDVVAVTGTRATVEITATLPIRGGALRFDDGSEVPLALDSAGRLSGTFRVAHDGFYRVDLVGSDGARVPGTVQHSVEALVDHPPTVRIDKPGRDTRVTAVEEVPISIRASDDYGVQSVELHYSVNGGPDRVVALTDSTRRSGLDFGAIHTLYLDELGLKVGNLVAYHAVARDGAGNRGSSDIYFMEVRPYDLNYRQADDNGGGGGGGGNNPGSFTERQRQLVAGTFNWQRDSARTSDRDRRGNATTLAIGQGKLRADVAEQAQQIAQRGVAQEDSVFVLVQAELDSAARAMKPAEDALGRHVIGEAIPAEEQALQHLQAADDAYRDITVRRQNGGGGGGGGGGQQSDPKDLADLFELQTDKLKNQYETPQSETSTPPQQAIDTALEKLRQLAARQQEESQREQRLADSLSQRLGRQSGGGGGGAGGGGSAGQSQGGRAGGQQGRSGQPRQGGQSAADSLSRVARAPSLQSLGRSPTSGAMGSQQRELARQAEEQARELERLSRDQNSPELADAARRMQQAADAMRQAAGGASGQGSTALDRLRQAAQNMQGAQAAGGQRALDDLARRAGDLGREQQQIANQVNGLGGASPAARQQQLTELDRRKDSLAAAVSELANDADRMARELGHEQPRAAAGAAGAADEIRNRRIPDNINYSKQVMRGGSADYARTFEGEITESLDSVARRLAAAAGASGLPAEQQRTAALDRTRDLVNGLQSLRDRTTGGGDSVGGLSDRGGDTPGANGGRGTPQPGSLSDRGNAGDRNGQSADRSGEPGARQGQQGGQPAGTGRSGQAGQSGQQGQAGQSGQGRPGQAGQSGQPGQAGQSGQGDQQGTSEGGRSGQQSGRSGARGGNGRAGMDGGVAGLNPRGGIGDPRQFRGEIAGRIQDAEALRRDLTSQGVDVSQLDRAIESLRRLADVTDPGRADQLQAAIIAGLKDFEFDVWRKFTGDGSGKPALGAAAQVPPEYRAMVEEYYRSLARKAPN